MTQVKGSRPGRWSDELAGIARKMRLDGRTYAEIAVVVGKTTDAVSGHFQRNPVAGRTPASLSLSPYQPPAAGAEPLKLRTFSWEES